MRSISGIYRWVDKIYEAQVYNYGLREALIEVVVPEPAALLRYLTSTPRARALPCHGRWTRADSPAPGTTSSPWSRNTWTRSAHCSGRSVYNVAGITASPPRFEVLGVALSTKTDEEHPEAGTVG